jgi:hypothetical protein
VALLSIHTHRDALLKFAAVGSFAPIRQGNHGQRNEGRGEAFLKSHSPDSHSADHSVPRHETEKNCLASEWLADESETAFPEIRLPTIRLP